MKPLRTACAALSIAAAFAGAARLEAEAPPLKLAEAIAAQQRLIDESPSNAGLYNDLGNLLFLDGQTRAAEEAYETSLELDPELVSTRYNLALLLQQTDRPRRAEREYRKVLKAEPQHAWAHYQSGVLLARRGKRSAAIQSFARSMRLDARITDPAFNPHIVENTLASSAVLRAYGDLSSAALAPRVYQNPGNVTSILLAAQAGAPRPEKRHQRRLERKQRRQERKAAERAESGPG